MINTLKEARPRYLRTFFQQFFQLEASSGILLMITTVVALVWANSPLAPAYFSLWDTRMVIGIGSLELAKPLLLWINDGLMAVFFFVVGLEIKREVLMGELSTLRRALLPAAAALGGMVAPAAIYLAIAGGGPGARGWGIPMATDIAFTLGVLALLGTRAPLALRVFLTALAIVDDIGAVLVIALFYTSAISLQALAVAAFVLIVLLLLNRMGVRLPLPYLLLGVVMWVAFVSSGVHATIAGVLLAMTIPARVRVNDQEFLDRLKEAMDEYNEALTPEIAALEQSRERREAAAQAIEMASDHVESPLHQLEHDLHPWVTYGILPVFALANAGVMLQGEGPGAASLALNPISLGIVAGLTLGKPLGITLLSWLAVRLGLAQLPDGLSWRHIFGAAVLAGIGFTMSIFIASLAFGPGDLLSSAKIGILAASLLAGVVGYLLLQVKAQPMPGTNEQEGS